jgi:Protein of unknown function DUF72
MSTKRHSEPSRQSSLFERENPEQSAGDFTRKAEADRLYCEPRLLLGTSAFTASGWQGTFYPGGMKSSGHLSFYATRFKTVEIDSTYYGTPSAATVTSWNQKRKGQMSLTS